VVSQWHRLRGPVRRPLCSAALACIALAAAAPAHAATKQRHYSPWDSDGNPVLKHYQHGSAECHAASRYDARSDAWRCVSGTQAIDPCFASPTDDEVFCAASPFARSGFLLGAVLDSSEHGNSPARGPWALQVGKRKCTRLAARKRKRAPTYRCGKSRKGPFLFGLPRTRRKTWTIRQARNSKGRRSKRVKVRAAWQ
jgi:hypothetical protein